MEATEEPRVSHGEWGSEGHSETAGHQSAHSEAQPGQGDAQPLPTRSLRRTPRRFYDRPLAMEGPVQEGTSPISKTPGHDRNTVPQENCPDRAVPQMPSSVLRLRIRASRDVASGLSLTQVSGSLAAGRANIPHLLSMLEDTRIH